MASKIIHCEPIASDLDEITTIQLDEERHGIYGLANDRLIHIDLNNNKNDVQIVYQQKRTTRNDDDDEEYSQGESDDENLARRVSDPFEDSEPSTDDDEDTINNRRNWRRYGWRIYQLDNPCSILFLSEENQLIVLNEGVIKILKIHLEQERLFTQGPSKNIFLYDFNVFHNEGQRRSIQPWSIAPTFTKNIFIFSLLDGSQLYSLDIRNENTVLEKLISTTINQCPYLVFHSPSNQIFVYNSTQIIALSLHDKTSVKIELPFIGEGKTISAMTIDKTGYIYILSDSVIYKYIWQSQLQLVESLGKIDVVFNEPQMIVTSQGDQFYFSDMADGSLYQSIKINA